LDHICKDIIKAIKKEGEIYVRDFQKITGYPSKTINLHLKHLDEKQISFQFKKDKKKYYFMKRKKQHSSQEIEEETHENIAKIRSLLKKTLSLYQKNDDQDSLLAFLKVGKLLLMELGKISIYKSGIEKKQYLKRWIEEENDLTKILENLSSPKNLEFRSLLKIYIAMEISNLFTEIEKDVKKIKDKTEKKKLN